ncbi:structure-specific endonuclease subunit SLX4 isoform X2 [Cheilinus undulatus]|uniref:structure-specific endonuclease subunit SLX4 isoform X2 n=1 Tax=Cheilinus undulatus TaxID=241271 RepID=UPI001BD1D91A|nr:structure-specific endonuclease subunit SLX4 isoform X2 [Cheilinus undulatus]
MDDSDQDFTDLCSKLLKRVRKKPADSRQAKKAEQPPSSQIIQGDKSRKHNGTNGDVGSKCAVTQSVSNVAEAGPPAKRRGQDSGDGGALDVPEASVALKQVEKKLVAKDIVLLRMQQFKRADPKRMVPESQTTGHKSNCDPPESSAQKRVQESFSPGMSSEAQDSDEALALRLQQELDREAAESQTVDLEEGGLFFCQICHRDLSHMTPEGRTQHLNRCLDESEQSAPVLPPPQPPPPPPPGVPDCPICGKKFKSQKSRSAHLKRCSTDLGVSPAVLLQAVQRQAEETQNAPSANTLIQTGGTKRKGPSKPGLPARKKPRKKTEPLDEDTMMALALSSSLLEQEKEKNRETESERQTETAASHTSVLKWRPDAGRGRGKKKVAASRPPQLLLIQDANTAQTRLQERVAALLLYSPPPSPPTPTLSPSSLPGWSGAAPLWHKSKLLDEGSTCLSDFYTPELREFITPWESGATVPASNSTINNLESPKRGATEGTPLTGSRASILPSSSKTPSSTPGTGQLPVGSQALRDLMELADDGMTLTQCGFTASGSNGKNVGQTTNLHLSGFVPEESEEQADLCVSGFLPDRTHTHSDHTHNRSRRVTSLSRADKEQSVAISRLSSDLSSMVNNPQLSDVQLQVDSGDVFFAHSFMLYARCPLLAEMIHESGFGVREEGLPAAQRVLISDVPGQAVLVLLQYLYTAHCSIPASLLPHVLELASRFDLQELQQLCKLHREDSTTEGEEEDYINQENINNQTDQALEELLRSMWNEEEEGTDTDMNNEGEMEEDQQADSLTAAEVEIHEEKVNEEEMEEIYEFAATQRKREDKEDSVEEEEVFTKLTEPRRTSTDLSVKNLNQTSPLKPDLSYSRLFSQSWGVYEEGDPSSATQDPLSQQHKSPLKPTFNLSGRALLQSSGSVVEENSLSPPPSSSNLPVTGQSPGLVGPRVAESSLLKQQSQHFQSICAPVSPHLSQTKKEPELIVLSDSSEEIEDVFCPCSSSPSTHTQIKTQPALKESKFTMEVRKSSSLEQSLGDLSPAPVQSYPAECSPEVSWLIPSTPLKHIQSTTSSSTQTRSSMCRTRLFSKHDVSSSSVFSSPALPSKNKATRVSTLAGPTEGSIPLVKLEEDDPCSSDFDLNFCSKQTSDPVLNKDRDYFAVPNSKGKALHPSFSTSSKQETPLHPHANIQPHSSTPLHTELHLPPAYPATSPLHCDANKQRSTSKEREKEPFKSPEKTELGSFHLSPLSDPSDPSSSSSTRGLQSSQRHSNASSHQSRHSVESNSHSNTEPERKGEMECENEDKSNNQEQHGAKSETQDADLSCQQSFMDMDEPPIAFNDSWGLDACADVNPGRFSLRLEESRGSSKQEDSPEQRKTARSSSSADSQPSPVALSVQSPKSRSGVSNFSPSKAHSRRPQDPSTPEMNSILDSKIWNSWKEEEDEEEEEVALPLSQRLNPSPKLKTPAATSHNKRRRSLVPITPMPHYSDMDTPELKNKLNRFGVRPLPKRQMILKLKEIHQYTHQLASSDSDGDSPSVGRAAQVKPQRASTVAARRRPTSCAQTVRFKEPRAPETSPLKNNREELLSASQGSNASSTAEESERSNPELCISSDGDSDSDGGISASQVASRLQDRLQAVRSFILSDSMLYTQILQYQPLVLSQLQQRLKAAGIRLGAAKLVDYLDSQCITFTTAKPGHTAQSCRRVKKTKGTGDGVAGRKKVVSAML